MMTVWTHLDHGKRERNRYLYHLDRLGPSLGNTRREIWTSTMSLGQVTRLAGLTE